MKKLKGNQLLEEVQNHNFATFEDGVDEYVEYVTDVDKEREVFSQIRNYLSEPGLYDAIAIVGLTVLTFPSGTSLALRMMDGHNALLVEFTTPNGTRFARYMVDDMGNMFKATEFMNIPGETAKDKLMFAVLENNEAALGVLQGYWHMVIELITTLLVSSRAKIQIEELEKKLLGR